MTLLALLIACTSSSSTAPLPADDGALPDLDAEIPAQLPDPTSQILLDVASGKHAPATLLDGKRGFVLVEVDGQAPDDPRSDPKGQLKVAWRVCGADAERRIQALQADLADRTQQGTVDVFECRGAVCVHPQRHADDASGSYAFQAPDGRHVLGVVVRMSHPPASPAMQRALEGWVDEQLRELTGDDCP